MLARGALDAEALGRLAGRLATFFRTAGGGADLRRAPDAAGERRRELRAGRAVRRRARRRTIVRRHSWRSSSARSRPSRDRFAARVRDGRIRDGHGDLRLEHVYFLPGADPLVIDCIEFNERFRCGDVAGEAAFLAMELEAARRPDLAAGFLARFAEESDDFGLYGVLDFYLSYRAFVRGKVAAFLAADAAAEPELRARKREEARRDFGLARSFLRLTPRSLRFVIVVGGVIGSGKSTLATALGRELAMPVISSDRTRKALAGLAPTERGGARALRARARSNGPTREVLRRAGEVLAAERGVILDATFSAHRWRAAAADLARAAGARFVFVETRCADRQAAAHAARGAAAGRLRSPTRPTPSSMSSCAVTSLSPRPIRSPGCRSTPGPSPP